MLLHDLIKSPHRPLSVSWKLDQYGNACGHAGSEMAQCYIRHMLRVAPRIISNVTPMSLLFSSMTFWVEKKKWRLVQLEGNGSAFKDKHTVGLVWLYTVKIKSIQTTKRKGHVLTVKRQSISYKNSPILYRYHQYDSNLMSVHCSACLHLKDFYPPVSRLQMSQWLSLHHHFLSHWAQGWQT